jgi:glycosyltransferase involved in cell wall biosynthesis
VWDWVNPHEAVVTQPGKGTLGGLPVVSVIVIFLNGETFLEEAIESVLAQTLAEWELFLVDDGSTDRSAEIAKRYARELPDKVRYLEHEKHVNRGMSASRNLAIRQANGSYIAFLDADDVWLPQKLERQVAILEKESLIAMVYGPPLMWYGWSGSPADAKKDFLLSNLGAAANTSILPPTLVPFMLGKAQRGGTPLPSCIMIRRDTCIRLGGFEEAFRGLFEDMVFAAKVLLAEPVWISDECWLKYRQHPAAASGSPDRRRYVAALVAYFNWLEDYLVRQKVEDAATWEIVRRKLFPYRHPLRYRLLQLVAFVTNYRRSIAEVKGLIVQLARIALPESWYRKLVFIWRLFFKSVANA